MRKLMVPLALVAVSLAAVPAVHAASSKDGYDLKGEVYGNSTYKIEMKNKANGTLKTIKAGTYRIKIEDKATMHNFHLAGPGVDRSTTIAAVGERIWTVRLTPGKYTFVCDPHAGQMRGSFRVTA
jgi:plastocyanin